MAVGRAYNNCINLGFGHLRGLRPHASDENKNCINLEFGHLRGLSAPSYLHNRYCINLGFGHLRGPLVIVNWKELGLYQPGILTPSRTLRRSHPGPRGLYLPGIWTPSKTFKPGLHCHKLLYQPGNCQDEDMMAQMKTVPLIVSTWDLVKSEDHAETLYLGFFIVSTGDLTPSRTHQRQNEHRGDCINLGTAKTGTRGNYECTPILYQPETWPAPRTP